jgi:hypothetical protein
MKAAARQQNLDSLWRGISNRAEIKAAFTILEQRSDKQLKWLLRHHNDGDVEGVEIDERDQVDSFLGVCGQLTVATIAGFVPRKWNGEIATRIGNILKNAHVRSYYEDHYPILLPSLLRQACTEGRLLPVENEEASWGAFQWFWHFSTRFLGDEELWWFLSLLDGFSYDGDLDITTFADFVKDPQRALAGVHKPPGKRSTAETCAIGMIRFLELTREFGDTLSQMEATPLTRSAIWFHYAYWYREFDDVTEHANKFLEAMLAWMDSPEAGAQSRRDAEASVARTKQALAELTGNRYAPPLLNALKTKAKDPTLTHFTAYR